MFSSCVLTLLLDTRTVADTDLGSGGGGLESEPAVGAFDAVRLSAALPAPTLNVATVPRAVPGEIVPVTVSVENFAAPDEILVLEQYVPSGWKAISSTAIDTTGRAALSVAQSEVASYRYRVRLAATTRHKAVAREFRVDVAEATASPSPTPTPTPTSSPAPEPSPQDPPESVPESPSEPPETSPTPSPSPAPSPAAAVAPEPASTPEPSTEGETAPGPARPEPPVLCGGEVKLRPDGTPWVCTYHDDFDGGALDRRYWVPQVSASSGFYSGTATQPACVVDDPRTIGVRDGLLALSAIVLDAPAACGKKSSPYVSGSVTHHGTFSQTYGRYEVRAKLPSYKGKGLQETFWLWPNDPLKYGSPHPASGEIDFGEFYSNHPDLNIAVMHYVMDYSTISYATNTNIYTSHWCKIRVGDFNTYTLEWAPGRMTILVNGTVCIVNNYKASNAPAGNPNAPFDSPFFLSLSQLFGTTGNEFDPATGPREASTVVDWVRVWA